MKPKSKGWISTVNYICQPVMLDSISRNSCSLCCLIGRGWWRRSMSGLVFRPVFQPFLSLSLCQACAGSPWLIWGRRRQMRILLLPLSRISIRACLNISRQVVYSPWYMHGGSYSYFRFRIFWIYFHLTCGAHEIKISKRPTKWICVSYQGIFLPLSLSIMGSLQLSGVTAARWWRGSTTC